MIRAGFEAGGHMFIFHFRPEQIELALDSIANYWCQGLLDEEAGLGISAELEDVAERAADQLCLGR